MTYQNMDKHILKLGKRKEDGE